MVNEGLDISFNLSYCYVAWIVRFLLCSSVVRSSATFTNRIRLSKQQDYPSQSSRLLHYVARNTIRGGILPLLLSHLNGSRWINEIQINISWIAAQHILKIDRKWLKFSSWRLGNEISIFLIVFIFSFFLLLIRTLLCFESRESRSSSCYGSNTLPQESSRSLIENFDRRTINVINGISHITTEGKFGRIWILCTENYLLL